MTENNPLDSNYENLTTKLSAAQSVIKMMEGDGWKRIVGPRINNMINEYTGCTTKNGLRSKGMVTNSADPYLLARNAGVVEGMTAVYNMIVSHQVNYESLKQRLEAMERNAKAPIENTMYSSPYAPGVK